MRLRNVKNKDNILRSCDFFVEDPINYKGKWKELFNNDNPIYIEIGTGKCNFIYENAVKYPNINFIGVERSASVLALGIKDLQKLDNLYLVNYDASSISDIFNREIDKIYLNFSDPWPKKRHSKRRLTSKVFLEQYDAIFKDNKNIQLKTDNRGLFEYSIISLNDSGYVIKNIFLDLHNSEINDNIMTEYEQKFSKKGCKIYMLDAFKK